MQTHARSLETVHMASTVTAWIAAFVLERVKPDKPRSPGANVDHVYPCLLLTLVAPDGSVLGKDHLETTDRPA